MSFFFNLYTYFFKGTPAVLEPQPAPSAQLDSSVRIQNLQWLVHLDITASQERSVVH